MTNERNSHRCQWSMGGRLIWGLIATAAPVFIGLEQAAAAEDNSSGGLAEIVVTATKRSESLESVPLSITAISADTLEKAQVESFTDYARLIPNLTFASGVGITDGRQVAIRGIYGADTTGFYIDEMPVPTSVDPRVFDIDRIEVLRGPQGTLFGARSMGGTIRMITVEPSTQEFSAKVSTEGSTLQGGTSGYQVSGTLNIPVITDRAALRFTAYNGRDGAFITREWPDVNNPAELDHKKVAGNDFTGVSVGGAIKVTDGLTIKLHYLAQQTLLDGFPLSDYSPDTLTQQRLFNIPEIARDRWSYTGMSINYSTALGTVTSATSYFNRLTHEAEEFSDYVALVFGTPPLPTTSYVWAPEHTFTEELRFASAFSGPVQFVGGLYYSHDTRGTFVQYINTPGLDAASGGALGTDLVFSEWLPVDNKERAVFGELTYSITSAWSVTAGIRYSHLQQAIFDTRSGLAAGQPDVYATQKQNSTTPKAVIKYQPNDNLNVYALASKGFRPGGAQSPPPESFCADDYATAGLTPQDLESFKSDSLWNYEVGAKTTSADRRLTINSALFWIDWKDIRQSARFSCGYNFTVNGGAARSRGGELEISAVPVDHLTLSMGLGYTDAVITASSPTLLTRVGSPVQQIAPWTASAAADYTFPITASLKGFGRADASYTDQSFSATNDASDPRRREPYTLVNLRAGVTTGTWDVAAFVENVGNTHANLGDNGSEAAELPGRIRWLINQPRRVGIQGVYRW